MGVNHYGGQDQVMYDQYVWLMKIKTEFDFTTILYIEI